MTEFETHEELLEAANGDWGLEAQEEALGVLEHERWQADMETQLGKLEHHLGRPITYGEEKYLVDVSVGNPQPDLVTAHARTLESRVNDQEERTNLGAEIYEEEERRREAESEHEAEGWAEDESAQVTE